MAAYAKALAQGDPLAPVAKEVVQDATRGYKEPWAILTTWVLAGKPELTHNFVCTAEGAGAAKNTP